MPPETDTKPAPPETDTKPAPPLPEKIGDAIAAVENAIADNNPDAANNIMEKLEQWQANLPLVFQTALEPILARLENLISSTPRSSLPTPQNQPAPEQTTPAPLPEGVDAPKAAKTARHATRKLRAI